MALRKTAFAIALAASCGGSAPHVHAPPPVRDAYVGSAACAPCHAAIYDRWKKTPMANVVRPPTEGVIIADLATNTIKPFDVSDVALVYGQIWKQRYFTKIGDDYFPQTAQWDVKNHVWRKYFVENGTDWWATLYPPDNMKRPTGPLCDGCHSVGYDIATKRVAEWNVGCERCHGMGAAHVQHPTATNIVNASRMDSAHANDTCIQCHSQGRPLTNPIAGRLYDWPVGYRVGLNLSDFWRLEEHKNGKASFTHFADGTAHKNRMQGNDFVRSVMYHAGITCISCHDAHGTDNPAQLRKPGNAMCLSCHKATLATEGHTHHREGSTGSACVACHMPQIEQTIANVRVRAHTFEFITPAQTDAIAIPNPCTSCHEDKTTAWATNVLASWTK